MRRIDTYVTGNFPGAEERVLWKGTSVKKLRLEYMKGKDIFLMLFGIIFGLSGASLCIFGIVSAIVEMIETAFDSKYIFMMLFILMFLAAFLVLPVLIFFLAFPEAVQEYNYIITDKAVYITYDTKKGKSAGRMPKISAADIKVIHLEKNKDGTATIYLTTPEIVEYMSGNVREEKFNSHLRSALYNVKDHEAACKYITMLMNSTK